MPNNKISESISGQSAQSYNFWTNCSRMQTLHFNELHFQEFFYLKSYLIIEKGFFTPTHTENCHQGVLSFPLTSNGYVVIYYILGWIFLDFECGGY